MSPNVVLESYESQRKARLADSIGEYMGYNDGGGDWLLVEEMLECLEEEYVYYETMARRVEMVMEVLKKGREVVGSSSQVLP
jgi:hypothetical protein